MNKSYAGEQIILSDHARSYLPIRGYEPEEVEQAIMNAEWQPARRTQGFSVQQNLEWHILWNETSPAHLCCRR